MIQFKKKIIQILFVCSYNLCFYLEIVHSATLEEDEYHEVEEVHLGSFQLFSRERTRERYYIIFVWEIAQQIVPGYDLRFSHGRTGRYCYVGSINSSRTEEDQKREENTLKVKGAKLFNLLPSNLRNYGGDVTTFTTYLDRFLLDIPDNTKCPLRACKGSENSLLELIHINKH
jgi:hypothetical protein